MKKTENFEDYIREELEVLVQNIHDMMEARGEPFGDTEVCPHCYTDQFYDHFRTANMAELWSHMKDADPSQKMDHLEFFDTMEFAFTASLALIANYKKSYVELLNDN